MARELLFSSAMRSFQTTSGTRVSLLSCSRPALLLVAAIMALHARSAEAYEVSDLPPDNLLENPWFLDPSDPDRTSFDGWVTEGSPTWSSDANVKDSTPGPSPWMKAPNARWARNSGQNPEFHPGVPVSMHQIVEADPEHRRLRFFMHFAMHRMALKVTVHGGPTSEGPWTELWVPLERHETVSYHGSSHEDIWQHFVTLEFEDWYSPQARVTDLESGHSFYKVQIVGEYGEPDSSPTGSVGGKFTGVYLSTEAGDGSAPPPGGMDEDPPDDPGDPGDGNGDPDGGAELAGAGCRTAGARDSAAALMLGLVALALWSRRPRRRSGE